ncbi:MAG: AsmA-like C-terminal region-containing protein [Alphaproteobacteria bacterium]
MIVRALAWAGIGIAGAIVLACALLFTLDLSFLLRHPIEDALSRYAGRQVIVNGEVGLIIWPHPALRLGDLFIANLPDGTRPDLVRAKSVEARLSLKGFPETHLVLGNVDADRASVLLERTKSGMSWMPQQRAALSQNPIKIRGVPFPIDFDPQSLVATNVTFAARLPWQDAAMTYPVDRLVAQTGGPLGAYIAMVGHLRKETWRADADLSSLQALLSGEPFKMRGRVAGLGAMMNFAGSASFDSAKASKLSGIGSAQDTQRLWGGGQGSAPTPASFTFSLSNSREAEQMLAHFQKLGAGDLDVALEFDGPTRDGLSGHISAKTLDLAALPHPAWHVEGKSLFSNKPIALNALAHAQIDLKVGIQSLNWRDTQIGRLELGVWSNNGILAAGPIALDGPETELTGDATLDVRAVPKLSLSLKAKLADLGAFINAAKSNPAQVTRADVALELLGTGNSLAEIMATSYGQTDVLIGPGDAGGELASVLPTEIAYGLKKDHSLAPLPNADRALNLACLVSRFDIAEGRATSRALFIDTSAATTTGQGTVDFTNESLDFHLAPRPKDPDLIGDARDIDLRGTLAEPVFSAQQVAAKGLSRMASETALAPTSDIIMPLLDPGALLANPCVRSLMSESALAGLRGRPAARSGSRAEAAP